MLFYTTLKTVALAEEDFSLKAWKPIDILWASFDTPGTIEFTISSNKVVAKQNVRLIRFL